MPPHARALVSLLAVLSLAAMCAVHAVALIWNRRE